MTTSNLVSDLERDEGFRSAPYKDTTGHWTWGYGHKLVGEPPAGAEINEVAAFQLLLTDIHNAKLQMNAEPLLAFWTLVDDIRQDVLVNMAFNLGVHGLRAFNTFLGFVRSGQYAAAADDLFTTLAAHQEPNRVQRWADQLRTGEHQ